MSLPTNPPSAQDLMREHYYAQQFIDKSPPAWDVGKGVRQRKPGTANDVWGANWVLWMTYPDVPEKNTDTTGPAATAWKRIRADLVQIEFDKANPSITWDPKKPTWPLPTPPRSWLAGSSFHARRPWSAKKPQTRWHAGVDLGGPAGLPVLAIEAGTILSPETGWESNTDPKTGKVTGVKALLLQTDSGLVVLYGGIRPGSAVVKKGQRVEAGEKLAEIGTYPLGDSMLHFQAWQSPLGQPLTEAQVNSRKSWPMASNMPKGLVDPSELLKFAATNPKVAKVGFVDPNADPDQNTLVPNDVEGGEQAEGAALISASDGRTGSKPCVGKECKLPDVNAWVNALLSYRTASKPLQEHAAKLVEADVLEYTPAASGALTDLANADALLVAYAEGDVAGTAPEQVQELLGMAMSVRDAINTLNVFIGGKPAGNTPAPMPDPDADPKGEETKPAKPKKKGGGIGLAFAGLGGLALIGGIAYSATRKKVA